jgi:hypothetical protein
VRERKRYCPVEQAPLPAREFEGGKRMAPPPARLRQAARMIESPTMKKPEPYRRSMTPGSSSTYHNGKGRS